MSKMELNDEGIEVIVKRDGDELKAISVDLLELRLIVEELEAKHVLKRQGGQVFASRAFLRDLAERLQEVGIEGASVSMACQLWVKLSEAVAALKKNTPEEPSSVKNTESTPSS